MAGTAPRSGGVDAKSMYSSPEVVDSYDQRRFATPAGIAFDGWEKAIVAGTVRRAISALGADIRAADIACGTGRFTEQLARDFGLRVDAADYSQGMLDATARRLGDDRAQDRLVLTRADIYDLPFESGTFDLVTSIRTLTVLAEPLRGLSELIRVLKPGGYLICDVSNRLSLARLGVRRARRRSAESAVVVPGQLSVSDMRRAVRTRPDAQICSMQGCLILSQTVLMALPSAVVRPWVAMDRFLCRALPMFATRLFFEIHKLGQ